MICLRFGLCVRACRVSLQILLCCCQFFFDCYEFGCQSQCSPLSLARLGNEMIRYVKSVDSLEIRADLRQRESGPPDSESATAVTDPNDFQVWTGTSVSKIYFRWFFLMKIHSVHAVLCDKRTVEHILVGEGVKSAYRHEHVTYVPWFILILSQRFCRTSEQNTFCTFPTITNKRELHSK